MASAADFPQLPLWQRGSNLEGRVGDETSNALPFGASLLPPVGHEFLRVPAHVVCHCNRGPEGARRQIGRSASQPQEGGNQQKGWVSEGQTAYGALPPLL